jgi:hypothetical protein
MMYLYYIYILHVIKYLYCHIVIQTVVSLLWSKPIEMRDERDRLRYENNAVFFVLSILGKLNQINFALLDCIKTNNMTRQRQTRVNLLSIVKQIFTM